MAKTETVHTRVTHDIKEQADRIFSRLGLTTSQAIMLFLTATVNRNGLPFELMIPTEEEKEDFVFANSIASMNGSEPSEHAKELLLLYKRGIIDYETALFAIKRRYKNTNS